MKERTVIFFIFSVCFYTYSVYVLFTNTNVITGTSNPKPIVKKQPDVKPNNSRFHDTEDPLFLKDACSVLEVFVQKPKKHKIKKMKREDIESDRSTITFIGISVFLMILLINALVDVLKVKEEERSKRKLNPNGERRQSLAEFANKKMLRRESSKFGQQLCQIEESLASEGDKKIGREARPYMRGDSINSYLSEKSKKAENSAPASIGEIDTRPIKRQSVAKLIGARPAPMVRRSSYPALPLNPEIQALMLGSKQASFDSDDEDAKGRRVRIIRRF